MLEGRDFCLEQIDDGHKPGNTSEPTYLANNKRAGAEKGFFSLYENVLSEVWQLRIYDFARQRNKPWGVYVTSEECMNSSVDPEDIWGKGDHLKAMAIVVTRALLYQRAAGIVGKDLVSKIAGTVVWCLASGMETSVGYHIDYAELFRYETNTIHPPLVAGTYHASPFTSSEDIRGGEFMVNVGGLDHYRRFGYKGRLQPPEVLEADMAESHDWITIPYKSNRGMMYDGDLPHLSKRVTFISSKSSREEQLRESVENFHMSSFSGDPADTSASPTTLPSRRVILGLNCFSAEVAECCQRAPEHSDAFNRTIKLYQAVAGVKSTAKYSDEESSFVSEVDVSNPEGQKPLNKSKKLSLEAIKANPFLKRAILLAAENVKRQQSQSST